MDTIAFGVGVRKVSWPDGYLGSANLQVILMLIGHFSHHYSSLFPPAREVLLNAEGARETAEKWNIRAEDMDYVYKPDSHV